MVRSICRFGLKPRYAVCRLQAQNDFPLPCGRVRLLPGDVPGNTALLPCTKDVCPAVAMRRTPFQVHPYQDARNLKSLCESERKESLRAEAEYASYYGFYFCGLSTHNVTGPQFTSSTSISAPKIPVSTLRPLASRSSLNRLYSGLAMSGRAAEL